MPERLTGYTTRRYINPLYFYVYINTLAQGTVIENAQGGI